MWLDMYIYKCIPLISGNVSFQSIFLYLLLASIFSNTSKMMRNCRDTLHYKILLPKWRTSSAFGKTLWCNLISLLMQDWLGIK